MKESLKNWYGTAAIIGVDWGDSGKGRLIDDLASRADIVARFAGGSNTGHTVCNPHGEFALHIMPSGIFNPRAINLIGRNVAVDLEMLVDVEMKALENAGVSYTNLRIDPQAHLTMPWHRLRDGLREELRAKHKKPKIGTTKKGVGPTYADRTDRVGLTVGDLVGEDFIEKLEAELVFQETFLRAFTDLMQNPRELNLEEIYHRYLKYRNIIKDLVAPTTPILSEAKFAGKNILFEGAQGYFLDIDAGTYPYVTSSHPGIVGIWTCFDLHPADIDILIGITKAYTTRVGGGPMPTKMTGEDAQTVIKRGGEIGTTTGRVRDPGWLDLVLVREAVGINRLNALAVTKLDVLSGFKTLKLCTGYLVDGQKANYLSHDAGHLEKCVPLYEELPGWDEDISGARKLTDLPANARKFLARIEKYVGIPVRFISVGPKRGEVIYI